MMRNYKAPKGVFDILPYGAKAPWQHSHVWQYLEKTIRGITNTYGFQEIRTPLFEHAEIFSVGIGNTSDIISKEMYTFSDKKQRLLALRPEGTSSILRAFFENSLFSLQAPYKFFYIAPMFRYEKPQKGRYRQHHQFGVEVLGSASYEQDAEIIDLLLSFYQMLGIQNLCVEINSVGDAVSRQEYKKALHSYLEPYLNTLSADSKTRFSQNILRILDSKNPKDQEILTNAPSILDYLTKECQDHFLGLEKTLRLLDIPYKINPKIVRGLDYYNKTVFEITTEDLGAQNAIGAGGRYDGFATLFAGKNIPGVGFGTGIERILQTIFAQNCYIPKAVCPFVFLAPMTPSCKETLFCYAKNLRLKGIPTEIGLQPRKIQDLLRKANQLQAAFCLILGEEEEEKQTIRCKNMQTRKEEVFPIDKIVSFLEQQWKEYSC